jgi:anhydro-N-acetylmuramic acid kinase
MIIDALVEISTRGAEQFDRDGRIAASGTVRNDLIERWLRDPYFALEPPKTTGRERFGTHHAMGLIEEAPDASFEDLIASATALTARSIADAYDRFIRPRGRIDEVIISGGGARNPALMRMIRDALPDSQVMFPEDVGLDNRAKEAVAIAVTANDSLAGLYTNVPGATGGKPAILGKINL